MEALPPGAKLRVQLVDGNRASSSYTILSSKTGADVYIVPKSMGGAVKVSLHASGSWQVGITKEHAAKHAPAGRRHWDIWKGAGDLGPGLRRAWYLLLPDNELRRVWINSRAKPLPPVGSDHAVSLEVLLADDVGPGFDLGHACPVARLELPGVSYSAVVVARRIPWPAERRAWAKTFLDAALAAAQEQGYSNPEPFHRLFLHGQDEQGVRFGLEMAAI